MAVDEPPRGVVVSYRRQDSSPVAGRLYDLLAQRFGPDFVFLDVESIAPGMDFAEVIARAVATARAMLVLIGDNWLDIRDDHGQRKIDDPDDFIRLELGTALSGDCLVIPVLIDDAVMPRPQDLPPQIRRFADLVPFHLRLDSFRADVEQLVRRLDGAVRGGDGRRPFRRDPALPPQKKRSLIFVSYSHADRAWLDRLRVHLMPLNRESRVETWDDTQIRVGDEWREQIREAISACDAAILLVSADFMASDFIQTDELPPLLHAAYARGIRIFSVLASSSHFEDSVLARYQALNSPDRPLDLLTRGEQEATFLKLYKSIRTALAAGDHGGR